MVSVLVFEVKHSFDAEFWNRNDSLGEKDRIHQNIASLSSRNTVVFLMIIHSNSLFPIAQLCLKNRWKLRKTVLFPRIFFSTFSTRSSCVLLETRAMVNRIPTAKIHFKVENVKLFVKVLPGKPLAKPAS